MANFYENYYTHDGKTVPPRDPFLKRKVRRPFRLLVKALGVDEKRRRMNLMYLDDQAPGRLLEIGCGTGERLSCMHGLGWKVEGQDVDPRCAALGLEREGLTIHIGPLADLELPARTYDAIAMIHVIEHVPNPARLLEQCHRLLVPGGRLVVVTPNVKGLGHRLFRRNWRDLDPPRHLVLHTSPSLASLAGRAGFTEIQAFTSSAHAELISGASQELRRFGRLLRTEERRSRWEVMPLLFQILEELVAAFDQEAGEECVLIARA